MGDITHAKVGTIPDGADPEEVLTSDWNDPHVVDLDAADVGADAAGTAASAVSTHEGASDPHTGYLKESDFTGVDFLVGTATGITASEIAVGTTPGGELGNTWASPTVDATHSGSSHAGVVSTHEGASDPHTGYRKESDTWTFATFAKQGLVVVTAEGDTPPPFRKYNRTGRTLTFAVASANSTIGPNGSTMTIDVNVDGTTIMTGTKVVLPDNTGAASAVTQTTFSTTTVADGHYVSVNVDTNGGGAVQNLLVEIVVTG